MKRQAPLKSILVKKKKPFINNIATEKEQPEISECPITYEDWHNIRDRTQNDIADKVIDLFIQHANWSVQNCDQVSMDCQLTQNESSFALKASKIYNLSEKEAHTLYLRIKKYFK
jgi:hypothetical protein